MNLTETLRLHKMWLNNEEGGTRANFTDATLTRATLTRATLPFEFTPEPGLIERVAEAALRADGGGLEMKIWHTCETTHCIAGWAVHLHPDGKRLEAESTTYLAGRLLLGEEAATHFYDSNENAKKYLNQFLNKNE